MLNPADAPVPVGLRAHLNEPGDSFNAILSLPDPGVAAIVGSSGYDYVVIDAEHGPFTAASMRSCIDALRAVGCPSVVRTAGHDRVHLAQALDLGADGVQLPLVRSAAEAEAAVAAARYAPEGTRGVGAGHITRHGSDGGRYLAAANANTGVLAMIEDRAGVDDAGAIAAVDGLDGLVIGLLDLSANLGVLGQVDHPDVVEAVRSVVDAAVAAGTRVGTGCGPDEVAAYRELGMTSFTCFIDGAGLGAAARRAVDGARDGVKSTRLGLERLRDQARRRLPRAVFDYIDGAADDEWTAGENRRAFHDLALIPSVLAGNDERDLSVTVLGRTLAFPVICAPTGLSRVAGRDGEIAAARAAQAVGTVSVVSGAASIPLSDIAAAVEEPQWFQLYLHRDRAGTEALVALARDLGFTTMMVTVDAPVPGNRERDVGNRLSVPVTVTPRNLAGVLRRPRWLIDYLRGAPLMSAHHTSATTGRLGLGGGQELADHVYAMFNSNQSWEDLAWVRSQWDGPLVVKGIMSAADARRAVEAGCEGVVVSNHGGRQLDGTPATIDMVAEVAAAIGDRATVLVDGGFRRGSDVAKALALGADACLVGRPWLFGLAAGGEAGVRAALETLRDELDRTLALLGATSCDDLDPSMLRRRPGSGWEQL